MFNKFTPNNTLILGFSEKRCLENEKSFHSRKRENSGEKGREVLEKEEDICAEEEGEKKDTEEILRGKRQYDDYYKRIIISLELSLELVHWFLFNVVLFLLS